MSGREVILKLKPKYFLIREVLFCMHMYVLSMICVYVFIYV